MSLRQPHLFFCFCIITWIWLVHALSIPTNDNKTLTSAELSERPGVITLERRVSSPLKDLLIEADQIGTRLDTKETEKEDDENYPPITSIAHPLGDGYWDLGIWNKDSNVVFVLVLQKRALLLQVPWVLVDKSLDKDEVAGTLHEAKYQTFIKNHLFGDDGQITNFLERPDEEVVEGQRSFSEAEWSNDAIQVFVRTRSNSDGSMMANGVLEQMISDLREALTAKNELPNILPDEIEDISESPESRFLLSVKRYRNDKTIAALSAARNFAPGIVLSWRPRKDLLRLWDGLDSDKKGIPIQLATQLTGLYPLGVGPTENTDGKKGCRDLPNC